MLLDYMRKNTKRFLYVTIPLIVVSFVLWGTIPDPGTRVGQTLIEIGKTEISYQQFLDYYHNLRQSMQANFGGALTPEIEEMLNLKQQALDGLIQRALLEREIERANIAVSDEEVQDSLKRFPEFQTEDRFDPAKWNAAIGNPRINWALVTEQEEQSLKIRKLMDMIQLAARVTEDEIKEEYRRQNEKVEIEFVALKTGDLAEDVELSEGEIASYYERHKEEYVEPAKVKLAYVELKKEPSRIDYEDAKEHTMRIMERVQAGDDFAELAEYYSDDTATKAKGGDLGFFRKGRMAKEFEEAAFSMKPSQVGDIVKTEFGYHIIKVEETRGDGGKKEVRARHILVKVEPSEDTLISLEEKAVQLAATAANSTLEEAAEQKGVSLSTTPAFSESSSVIPGIGLAQEITEILPGLQEGKASDVIEADKAFYVVQVDERAPERTRDVSEVEERARAAAKAEKALAVAKTRAEEIVAAVNESGTALADIDGIPEPQQTEPFTRRGYAPELPYIDGLTNILFELAAGEAAGPFVSGDSVYVAVSKRKIEADPEGYETERESIRDRILSQRKRQVFDDYFENLRERAGVKINNELFEAA